VHSETKKHNKYLLLEVLETNAINVKRYEVNGRTVLFYFNEIPSTCRTCVRFIAVKEYDMGKVKPQPVKIYDYYEPGRKSVGLPEVNQHRLKPGEVVDLNVKPSSVNLQRQGQLWISLHLRRMAELLGFLLT